MEDIKFTFKYSLDFEPTIILVKPFHLNLSKHHFLFFAGFIIQRNRTKRQAIQTFESIKITTKESTVQNETESGEETQEGAIHHKEGCSQRAGREETHHPHATTPDRTKTFRC